MEKSGNLNLASDYNNLSSNLSNILNKLAHFDVNKNKN